MVKIFNRNGAQTAPQIAPKLKAAEQALAEIEAERGDLALADVLGQADARANLAAWTARVAAQREAVANLRAAHAAAQRADSEADEARRGAIRHSQMAALKRHLGARDEAASDLARAIAALAGPYARLLDESAAARAAAPLGSQWPTEGGAYTELGVLRALVANELHRVLHGPLGHNNLGYPQAFPGASAPSVFAAEPDKITPLAESIKAASNYVVAYVEGKPLAEASPQDIAPAPATEASQDEERAMEVRPQDLAGAVIDARTVPIPRVNKLT